MDDGWMDADDSQSINVVYNQPASLPIKMDVYNR
jgi:hypothetical protein